MNSSSFPSSLIWGCKSFFGLSDQQVMTNLHIDDPYWKVSPFTLLISIKHMFEGEIVPGGALDKLEMKEFWKESEEIFQKRLKNGHYLHIPNSNETKHENVKTDNALIGIGGKMHHGKSTVANYMTKKHGFVEYAFASPLKEGCMYIFGFTREQVTTDLKDEVDPYWKVTPRYVLQQVGTDMFRNRLKDVIPYISITETLWIDNFLRWYEHHKKVQPRRPVVISDVRFPDELEAIAKLGGHLVKVVRPFYSTDGTNSHASETSNLQFNYELLNDSTIDVLYEKTDKLLKTFSK